VGAAAEAAVVAEVETDRVPSRRNLGAVFGDASLWLLVRGNAHLTFLQSPLLGGGTRRAATSSAA
jgi:hypothetical protein